MRKSSKKHKSIFTIACIKGVIMGCNKNAVNVTESKLYGRNAVAEWVGESPTLDDIQAEGRRRDRHGLRSQALQIRDQSSPPSLVKW